MNKKLITLLATTSVMLGVGCTQKDTEAPVITVNNKVVTAGTKIDKKDLYSVKDNMDDNPTVKIDGDLDTSVAGTYKLTVVATDKSGNKAEETVKVVVKGDSNKSEKEESENSEETTTESSVSNSSKTSDSSSSSSSTTSEAEGNSGVVVDASSGTGASKYAVAIDTSESDSEKSTSTKTAENEEEVKKFIELAKSDPSQFLSSGSSLLNDGYSEHAVVSANGHTSSETWSFINNYLKTNPTENDVDLYELYYYADGTNYGWRTTGSADNFVGIVVSGTSNVPTSVS